MNDERNHFSTYEEFMAYLDRLGLFHMDLSLDRISRVLNELELARPPYAVAQVVGTNGKGSTSSFLAALGTSTGLEVGLYTSPHFLTPRERIRINGHMLDEDEWCDLANDVMDAGGSELTYFEFLTVMAVLAFYDYEVDLAVFEAGLGGMYDATTAVESDVTVFTPFALDHEAVLGGRIEDIARDKSQAMRKDVPAVFNVMDDAALSVLRETARQKGTSLHYAGEMITLPDMVSFGLKGTHQKNNARLALGAFKLLVDANGWEPPEMMGWDDVKELAMADAWIAGRFQRVAAQADHPELILDGAHNEHALAALKDTLWYESVTPAALIFGCMKDKSLAGVVPLLLSMTKGPIYLPPIPDNDRALAPEALADMLGDRAVVCASMGEALRLAKQAVGEGPVLLCGSLYLLAEFFTLRPKCLENQ